MTALSTPAPPSDDVLSVEHALGDLPRTRRKTTRLERATRRAESIALRRAGVRVDAIAQKMGVTPRTVNTWISEAIRDIPREEADLLRRIEMDRLDALQAAQWSAAMAGDYRATDLVLKVMERRARLPDLDRAPSLGMDAVGSLLDALVLGKSEG